MRYGPLLGISLVVVLLSAGTSTAQPAPPAGGAAGAPPPGDTSGKGAVLCAWGLLDAARAAGRECFKGQDAAFQSELDASLARIDAFILKNSVAHPVTPAGLQARRAAGLQQLHAGAGICAGDASKLYQALRTQGADQLRTGTDDLLSIPREPVMNPCL